MIITRAANHGAYLMNKTKDCLSDPTDTKNAESLAIEKAHKEQMSKPNV